MKEIEKKTGMQKEGALQKEEHIKQEILSLLEKITSPSDLDRIRNFVEYIYIHH